MTVSLPERRYDLAGALMADAIADSQSTGRTVGAALSVAARQAGRDTGVAVRDQLGGDVSTLDPRAATVTALEQLGYEPRERGAEIVLANCPFHALAERHRPLVCGMNLDLLSGLCEGLGAGGELESRLEPADGLCCVRLAAPPR